MIYLIEVGYISAEKSQAMEKDMEMAILPARASDILVTENAANSRHMLEHCSS